MNWFAPFFTAHDAFWSSLIQGPSVSRQSFIDSDTAAAGLVWRAPCEEQPEHESESAPASTSSARSLRLPTTGTPQWLTHHFEQNGDGNRVKIYIPSTYDGRPLPMLVMLHGAQQDADDFAAGTQMNDVAEKAGFIVVYPEQSESANLLRCWNWFNPSNQARDSGETAALAALTSELIVQCNADPDRVYVAGLSAGGAMAINLAVVYPDLYAAAAVHSGVAFGVADEHFSALCAMNDGRGRVRLPKTLSSAAQTRAVPLIVFHGDSDDVVHPRNSEQIVEMSRMWRDHVIDAPLAKATHVEREDNRYAYTHHVWEDQDGLLLGEQWLVHGLGHAWSGGHPDGTYTDVLGPDASAEIVRFVSQFSLDR